ncbi:hypothetical protein QE422_002994 [Chryseobacterium sp. SORGH_AS 447]|uniref:hypothetical protein n=1 Tax=Chryseobacterium sp. SORGH_AS_0447 TaxID=3041769 RepID=UPI002788BEAD|nr:hypothetical protein [Chryseobacterium sp. SORGH_AS_0447]MDQ1162626.1 hypothetical protein [Chryseobacterium sp. SORGH_AS_0447]
MINFSLREFVNDNLNNFDPRNSQDLIKAEKLLKAESKLNKTFSINEIEEFLDYLKNQTQEFKHVLNLPVIKSIYHDVYPENLSRKPDLRDIPEHEIEEFREIFSPYLEEFISVSIRNNQWQNLIFFQHFYSRFFSTESLDFYKELLHDKNDLIIDGIMRNDDMVIFRKNYPFAVDKKFYYLQSLVDNFEFDNDILTINNAVAENQKTSVDNKVVLGEILMAILHFTAASEVTRNIIRQNQAVAEDWKNQKSGFFNNLAYGIANYFANIQNSGFVLFLSIVILGLYLLSYFFVITLGSNAIIFYAIANAIILYLAYRNFKYYFNFFNPKDLTETLAKLAGTLLITLTTGFPILLVIGFGIIYAIASFSGGKFPAGVFLPLVFIGVKLFKNRDQ